MRGEHTATCASGARAEERGNCDCGAGERPYRVRLLDEVAPDGRKLVEIQVDGPLTTTEATMFSIAIQELTREEGLRWSQQKPRKKKAKIGDGP
jgi:hypothetical protein